MSNEENDPFHISLTAEIVSAYVSHNPVPANELPGLIASVQDSLSKLYPDEAPREELKPVVPIKKSVTRDFIACLEDGKKFKSLKRHLSTKFDMTPQQYREKWNLPDDCPMVAPAYAEARSALAKEMGLGRKPGQKAPAKRTRRKAA